MKKAIKSIFVLMMCAVLVLSCLMTASSSGSENLTADGGYRAYLEYYCTSSDATSDQTKTAGITRKTYINVYLNEGETLYLGSSIYNSMLNEQDVLQSSLTGSDIVLVKPDNSMVSFDVIQNGAGHIVNPTQEAAGPNINGKTGGFTPLSYVAETTGIYQIHYHSQTGVSANPSPVLVDQAWTERTSTVAAWNATVVTAGGTVKTGRSFTKCLALNMGGNKAGSAYVSLNSSVYVVTSDGYIYQTDFNGMNPFGFIFFANNRGLVTLDSNYSQYQSFVSNDNKLQDMQEQNVTWQNPWNDDTNLDKTFNIFFETPDPELEGILYPTAYEPETAKNLSFIGSSGTNQTHIGYGGYFKFDITKATSATITIDLSDVTLADGSPAVGPVLLSNPVTRGTNYFYWNGCDAAGNVIPVGTYDSNTIKVTAETHSGEYHFPLIDAEAVPNGLKITRINKIYQQTIDADGNIYNLDVSSLYEAKKSYLYYDNAARLGITAYHNQLNTIGDNLNAKSGVDSTNGAMAFGYSGTNGKGDQTLLDMWTYANGNTPLSVALGTEIIINDDQYMALTGRVFYDKQYASLTASDNYMNVGEGDFTLSDVSVALEYQYTDLQGNSIRKTVTTQTGADGRYYFTGIPVMESGSSTQCTVTVTKPLPSYQLTTAGTTTNAALTNGTESQSLSVDKDHFVSETALSDVGYHYDLIQKSLVVKKDWVTSISSDHNRPDSVSVLLRSYYTSDGVKTKAEDHTILLENGNGWHVTLTDLPRYYDSANTLLLSYETVSETYTLQNGTTYTFAENTNDIYPYITTFTTQNELSSQTFIVTNAPKKGTIQITKRDTDTADLLQGVTFGIWKKTALTAIPTGQETVYREENNVIYHLESTSETNANGIVVFSNLEINDYIVTETAPKAGYKSSDTAYPFSITSEALHFSTNIYNTKLETGVTVVKKVDRALAGVSVPITVEYADNSTFQNATTHRYTPTMIKNKTEYVVCTLDIPAGSFVRVTEGNTAEYLLDEANSALADQSDTGTVRTAYANAQSVSVVGGHSYTVTLNNLAQQYRYDMHIRKVDGNTQAPLTNAEFTVYSDAACQTVLASASTALSGEFAEAAFTGLQNGTYYIKETKAPSGYLLPSDVMTVVIGNDGAVTVGGAAVTVTDNVFTITAANYLGISVPQSGVGRPGAVWMLAGLVLCFLALCLLIYQFYYVDRNAKHPAPHRK